MESLKQTSLALGEYDFVANLFGCFSVLKNVILKIF
jgi:hypothetical protein